LFRYDVAYYGLHNSPFLSNLATCVYEDENGLIYVGTRSNGLWTFDGQNWTSYIESNIDTGISSFKDIIKGDNNDLYFSSPSGGFSKFNGTTWELFNTSNCDMMSNYIIGMTFTDNGNLYIASDKGLSVFDGYTWYNYDSRNSGLPVDPISSIEKNKEGDIYIGNYNKYSSLIQEVTIFHGDQFLSSNVTGAHFNNNVMKSELLMYPNPATKEVFFGVEVDYSILDIQGRTLIQGFGEEVNVESLNEGVYIVRVGEKSQKLIIE
jgi:ligand-binding sensor domain-containing protein